MYRLKLISPDFGIDDRGPLHPSREQARRAAEWMLAAYKGRVKVEIHRVVDLRINKTEKLEELRLLEEGAG
ncbi:hypothetical protein CEK28_09020 [Xenophilus sp. AP218F]|nr:hypothetical protein CEK28_09020 [Xenophilus sp. AP218F]